MVNIPAYICAVASSPDHIERVYIPDTVKSIGTKAFYCCNAMTIYGVIGSYAETYADQNSIPFKDVKKYDMPMITGQPRSVTLTEGEQFSMSIEAEGENLSYQWQYQGRYGTTWNNFANGTGPLMIKTAKAEWDSWKVRCLVTNGSGNTVISETVVIIVKETSTIRILRQPESVSIPADDPLIMIVLADGDSLSYQWQYQGSANTWRNFANATGAILIKKADPKWNGWKVRCVISDGSGNTEISKTAEIKVTGSGVKIEKQPESVAVEAGKIVSFKLTASGNALSYQWQYQGKTSTKWNNFANATGPAMNKTASAGWDGWKVRCIVKDSSGNTAVSDTATITIRNTGITITSQPQPVTTGAGRSISFSVAASGKDLQYQWQYQGKNSTRWTNFTNATGASISKTAGAGWDGWKIRCIIYDSGDNVVSTAIVTVTIK